jgi:MFS family permease
MPMAITFAAIGTTAALVSLVAPRGNRVLYVGLTLLAFPIGFVLSYVIMGTLYFLIIGPVAVVLRLFRRDSMHRGYDASASTCWSTARPARDKESYFHQY